MLFWAYGRVIYGLKIADPTLNNRLSQIHSTITAQINQLQTVLVTYQTNQVRLSYGPPDNAQNAAAQINEYRIQSSQEALLRAQQVSHYSNRLFTLTQQQGVPMAQAKLIAEAETGYRE